MTHCALIIDDGSGNVEWESVSFIVDEDTSAGLVKSSPKKDWLEHLEHTLLTAS